MANLEESTMDKTMYACHYRDEHGAQDSLKIYIFVKGWILDAQVYQADCSLYTV